MIYSRRLFFVVCVLATACGGDSVSGPDTGAKVLVTVSPSTVSFAYVGQTRQLSANTGGGSASAMSWTSSNTSVATVSASGLVTAVANGSATVTASFQGSAGSGSGSAQIVVQQEAASVTVTPLASTLTSLGQAYQLAATAMDGGGGTMSASFTWSSSDPSVAIVDQDGLVTSVANGSTTITASVQGTSVSGAAGITVDQTAATVLITLSSSTLSFLGESVQLTASATDGSGNAVPVGFIWSSSDLSVLSVDSNGLVSAEGNGVATIVATVKVPSGAAALGLVSASGAPANGSVTITVRQMVATLGVTPEARSMVSGQTLQLLAVATDPGGSAIADPLLTWSSSDPSVAAVDGTGLVTAGALGSATITAVGDGQSATSGIQVEPPGASSLVVHAGDGQEAAPGSPVTIPPSVLVLDQAGDPVAGVPVTFSVEAGGGAVSEAESQTDADGIATLGSWTLGPLAMENRLRVTSGELPPLFLTASAVLLVPTSLVDGTVTLPDGSGLDLETLSVQTPLAGVPVQSDGTFTTMAVMDATLLATVEAPNGNPVLLSWVEERQLSIDARSTAEVLAFFDLGIFMTPDPAARQAARSFLAEQGDLQVLEAAVAAALTADPAGATLETAAIVQARRAVQQQLLSGPSPAATIHPSAVPQSGIEVNQVGLNSLTFTNRLRRRVAAFVDRVSYVPSGGGAPVNSSMPGSAIRIGSVTGATSLIGTVVDMITGNWAYEPVVVGPTPVPLSPADAESTRYRVIVVGPGRSNPSVALNADQLSMQRFVSAETLFFEFVFPLIKTALAVDKFAADAGGGEASLKVLKAFLDFSPPGVLEKVAAGNMSGAAKDIAAEIVKNGDLQEALLGAMIQAGIDEFGTSDLDDLTTGLKKAERIMKLLGVVDMIAGGIDLAVVFAQVDASNAAESWDVTVTGSRVRLNPPVVSMSNLDVQTFEAVVVDATGGGPAPTFYYRWSTSGNVGKLCSALTGSCRVTPFVSSGAFVAYAPNPGQEGTDEVSVEVFIVVDGQQQVIGAETANIEVYAGKVHLTPRLTSLHGDESQAFDVRVDDELLDGGSLSYRFSTSGRYGTLTQGGNGFEGKNTRDTYTARTEEEGTETVTVEAFSTKDGVKRLVGKATSTIRIEKKKSMYFGSWDVRISSDGQRDCASVIVKVPLREGVTHYHVETYGYKDGSNAFNLVPPILEDFVGCPEGGFGNNGKKGDEYWRSFAAYIDPNGVGDHPYNERFGGMVVEVHVTY